MKPRVTLVLKPTFARVATIAAIIGLTAMSLHVRSVAQGPVLPVPRPRTDFKGWVNPANPYRMIIRNAEESMLLAQVTAIQQLKDPVTNIGLPEVAGGTFHVIEVLSGPAIEGALQVVNPPEERRVGIFSNQGPPATSVLRKGELWILYYNNRTREVDKWTSFWLTGPNEPVLAQFRVHKAWMSRRDSATAISEMESVAGNRQLTLNERFTALLTLQTYSERSAYSIQLDPGKEMRYKQAVTDLLADGNMPAELRSRLIQMTYIDLTHELAPDSSDTLQLQALLNMVAKSRDDSTVDDAAARLYFVMVQQPSARGSNTIYFCPEIVNALEARAAGDAAYGKTSVVSRTLSNLDLAKRRSLQEINQYHDKRNTTVVIRHVPPISNSPISKRILAATQR